MSLCLWLMNFNLFTIASRCTWRERGDVIWVQIIYRVLRPLCAGCVESDHERKQVFDWNFVKTWEYSYARLALTISWFWSLKLYATLWDIYRVFSYPWVNMVQLWFELNFESFFQRRFSVAITITVYLFLVNHERKMYLTYFFTFLWYLISKFSIFCHLYERFDEPIKKIVIPLKFQVCIKS